MGAIDQAHHLHERTVEAVRRRWPRANLSLERRGRGWPRGVPTGIVIHIHGFVMGDRGELTLDGLELCRRMMRQRPGSSTHLVVDWPDGRVWCPIPLADRAWHCLAETGGNATCANLSAGHSDDTTF